MPIESIQTPKAPKGWRPNADQQQQINGDPRLQKMSLDDQYLYFNKPKMQAPVRGSAPSPSAAPGTGLGSIFSRLNQAFGGN